MKRRHFEALRPVCPLCRSRLGQDPPLKIGLSVLEHGDAILQGALHCTNSDCQCEYPIVDGIPLLVPQVRSYIANNIFHLLNRDDLSDDVESMMGDGCGPGSALDATRQYLTSYAWDHYAEFDPAETPGGPQPGSVVRVLDRGLDLMGPLAPGPILDAGCSVGRTAFALAGRSRDLTLGVDLNLAMLRLAANTLHHGLVRYPRRRVGLVYDRREFPVHFENQANVDFWACDATALPFPAGTFATAVSLNVLDCTAGPLDLLRSLCRVLRPGAMLMLTAPYDWSAAATQPDVWIGGHSKRSAGQGASEPVLRALLTPGAHAVSVEGLELRAEIESLPWRLRLHDRSVAEYRVHLVVAQRSSN